MTPTTDVTIEVSDLDLVKCRRCGAEVRAPRPAYPLRMTAVQRRLRTAGITEGEARDMLDAGEGGRLLTLPGIGPRTIMGLVCDCLTAKPPLGRVAAGEPILAVEQAEDSVKVDRVLLGGHREVFALRIVGESMIEDGIFDGDYVFVKKTPTAHNGDIVIALIDEEATCKRYFREGERIRFQPANSEMQPIYVHKKDFRETMIIGRVVGVYRRM